MNTILTGQDTKDSLKRLMNDPIIANMCRCLPNEGIDFTSWDFISQANKEYQDRLMEQIKIKGEVIIIFRIGDLRYLNAALKLLDKNDILILNQLNNKTYQFKLKREYKHV